jgi:putative ABC transport system permease protein
MGLAARLRMDQAEGQSVRGTLWREVWSLAWKDLRHDGGTTLVLLLTVAAILAPLLLLLGLKNGVVETLRETLLRDPRNLEVIIHGSARLEQRWFAEMAGRPDVAFVIPKTRTINTSLDLLDPSQRLIPTVELIPTAPGDPLLPPGSPLPRRLGEVLVTETLARRLALGDDAREPAAAGADGRSGTAEVPSQVTAVIRRTRDGRAEHLRIPLAVLGVVPEARFSRDALFTTLDLLVMTEDYRDGTVHGLPDSEAAPGSASPRQQFANARLYARDLDEVSPLAADIAAQGIEVRTQAERIASIQAMDRTLGFLLRVIALIGGTGCALALGGALWVGVERKRRQLALLRLFGLGPHAVAALPVLQGLLIAVGGILVAGLGYALGAQAFDLVLGRDLLPDGDPTRLGGPDLVVVSLLVLLVALIASSAGAVRASAVSPAEGLRGEVR